MKTIRFLALLLGAFFMVNVSFTLAASDVKHAQSHHGKMIKHYQDHLDQMVKELALTSDQKERIKKILEDVKPDIQKNVEQIKDNSLKINEMLTSSNYNKSTLQDLAKAKGEAIANLVVIRVDVQRQIYDVLNADQKAKWEAKVQKMKAKWKAIREKMESSDYTE